MVHQQALVAVEHVGLPVEVHCVVGVGAQGPEPEGQRVDAQIHSIARSFVGAFIRPLIRSFIHSSTLSGLEVQQDPWARFGWPVCARVARHEVGCSGGWVVVLVGVEWASTTNGAMLCS